MALTAALLGMAVAAVAAPGAPEHATRAGSGSLEGAKRDAVEAARERMLTERIAREQRRRSPEARAQRTRTRTAFAELAPGEAIQLSRQAFRDQLTAKPWKGVELADGERVERFLGERAARVARPGKPDALVESTLPLRAEDEQGDQAPVDLSLRDASGHLAPINPLTPVVFSKDPREGATLERSDVSFALVGVDAQAAVEQAGDRVVVPEALVDTDAWIAPRPGGFQTFATLRSAASPEQLVYRVGMPAGAQLRAVAGGGAEVLRDGAAIAAIAPPVAWDADGENFEVSLRVEGDRVILDVPHRAADLRYPLLVDPYVAETWNWHNGSSGYDGWSSSATDPNTFDAALLDLPHRWGRGLYVFTRNGSWVPEDAAAGWDFFAPGETSYVYSGTVALSHAGNSSCAAVGIEGGDDLMACGSYAWQSLSVCGVTCGPSVGTPGAELYAELFATYGMQRTDQNKAVAAVTAATAYYSDSDLPDLSGVTGGAPPAGWVRSWAGAVGGVVKDTGLGLGGVGVDLVGAAWGTGEPSLGCLGTTQDPCPREVPLYEIIDTSLPDLASPQVEGRHALKVSAADPAYNLASRVLGELKLDRGGPTIALGGSLWTNRVQPTYEPTLAGGAHNLTIAASDGVTGGAAADERSGVRSIEVRVDGETVVAPDDVPCPSSSCGLSRSWSLATGEFPAGKRTIAVIAKDHAGNQTTTSFEVKVPPAGELTWPGPGQSTSRWLPIQAQADTSGYSSVRFQYRKPLSPWTDIPTSALLDDVGQPVASVNQPLVGDSSPKLNWDLAAMAALVAGTNPQALDVRAVFGGGNGGTSKTVKVSYDPRGLSTDDAQAELGVGTVNLATGNLSVSETDAGVSSWLAPITVSRTLNSRDPGTGADGPFGPGWVVATPVEGVADYVSITESIDPIYGGRTAVLTTASGGKINFWDVGGGDFAPEEAHAELTLTKPTADYQLTDDDGTAVIFHRQAGTTEPTFVPIEVRQPGSANRSAMVYEIVAGKPRIKRLLAPSPAGVNCGSNHNVRGCRSLTLVYASGTSASGTTEGGWGSYLGRVERIELTAYDPATSAMRTDSISQYLYDSDGRLRAQWDPRIAPALKQRYAYDIGGRLVQLAPASGPAVSLGYRQLAGDQDAGRLASMSRQTPQGTATTTLVYDVPVSGPSAPYAMGVDDVAAWAQSDIPFSATAVFPPDAVPASNPPASYERATIHYLNRSGLEVNAVAPGGSTTTSEYDRYGNVVRSLSPSNRARALASGGLSADVAERLDTKLTYEDEGLELVDELGPEREVKLNSGVVVQAREHTRTEYDEGAPSGANPHLPTTVTTSAKLAGGSRADFRVTKHQYDWTLRAPTVSRQDYEGLDLFHGRSYMSDTGQVWRTSRPGSGGVINTYYSASGTAPCGGRPEWANLLCESTANGSSGEPITALPDPARKRYVYNRLNQVTAYTETSEGVQRMTETTYDAAGRQLTSKVSSSDDAPSPVVALGFEEPTGSQVDDSSGTGNHGTIQNGATRVHEGRFGRALRFDGVDDRVRIADAASLDLPGAMTLEAWVRPDVLSGQARNVIARDAGGTGCTAPAYGLRAAASSSVSQPRGGWCNGWAMGVAATTLKLDRWSHLAVTKSGYTLRLYVNGEEVASGASTAPVSDVVGDVLIGDGAGGRFAGLIDEVRVYGRTLTSGEIKADMARRLDPQAGPPQPLAGLQAAYAFEDAARGGIVEDVSPNANDMLFDGGIRVPGGRHGGGVTDLTGRVDDSSSLATDDGLTLAAWLSVNPYGVGQTVVGKGDAYSLETVPSSAAYSQVVFSVSVGGVRKSVSGWVLTGRMKHVAGTYDGQTLRLMIDGAQVASLAVGGPIDASDHELLFDGSWTVLDEVRVYGRALSVAEVGDDSRRPIVSPRRVRGAGAALPMTTTAYDPANGLPVTVSTTEEGVTRTITTQYDSLGRITGYTDADGNTSTTSYDLLGRPTSVADGKGTQSFTYDPVTGQLVALEDSHAGTFEATYDVEGKLLTQTLPNGVVAETTYDETGAPTALEYVKQDCSSNCTWFAEQVQESVHGQWRTRDSSLSGQVYTYDGAGRLTRVADTPTGQGCTTRSYAYDRNSNRTSRTTRGPGAGGACDVASPGQVQLSTYDIFGRLAEAGVDYDQFGRMTVVPASHSGGDTVHTQYYVNDMVKSQRQGNVTKDWLLDPTQARHRATAPSGTVQEVMHYSDGSDSPAWTAVVDNGVEQSWERTVSGIDGGLAAIVSNDGEDTTVELQLANMHGDITATASTSTGANAPTATFESDEFGIPRQGAAKKYGWLGGKERRSVLPSGVIQMGVRSYVPAMGRFTSIDPVVGGSANDYDYSNADPVNQVDLNGMLPGWIEDAASFVARGVDLKFGKYEPWAPMGEFDWNRERGWKMKKTCLFGAAQALFRRKTAVTQARKCLTPAAQVAAFGTTWFGALVDGIKEHGTQIRCTWTGLQEAPCVHHDYTKEKKPCGPTYPQYNDCGSGKRKRRR